MNLHKTLFLAVTLPLLAITPAFGMAGDLPTPALSFPEHSSSRTSVMKVVSDKQFRYLQGHYINALTKLHYAGDAASLNDFLARLAKCEGITVSVSFDEKTEGVSWTLEHNAWADAGGIQIDVNTRYVAKAAVKLPQ